MAELTDLVFIDTETTGLDCDRHEVLEVALLRIDPKTLQEKGRYHAFFLPLRDPSEEVAKINGYDRNKWIERGARDLSEEALQAMIPLLEGAAFAGQNPAFDRGFIHADFESLEVRLPKMDYHLIDVAVFAWPLFVQGLIPGVSLRHTMKFFGLGEQPHGALGDVLATVEVYKRFMSAYGAAAVLSAFVSARES